jgi:hypothetical protein
MSDALRMAAFSFSVDKVTAEVTKALEEASIPSIVLKGPGIATWLYSGDRPRVYNDTDLLLRRQDWDRALALVEKLGFEDDLGPLDHPRMESGAGYPFKRHSDGHQVDLHYILFGIGVDPETLWEALSLDSVRENVGGREVHLPSQPARLMHIALHAVQHGGETWEKPMMDLGKAIEKAPLDTWKKSLTLAERLEAGETFSAGLRLTADGRELAKAIGAEHSESVDTVLRLEWVPMAEGFKELSQAKGLRRKAAIVVREIFPTPTFMRWWSPMARRGFGGLILAYIWRPIWLAYKAVPGYLAWRRASKR